MRPGARAHEELETLFEDAFVIRDRDALAELFEDGADDTGGAMSNETSPAPTLAPVAVPTHEGEARWWFGLLAVIKATAADTGGQMTIVEVTNPPGWEGPLHVHHREDEGFWILEGDATIEVGERTIHAGVGDYVFGPRHIPHRYTVGEAGCRMLFILTPGGMEDLVRQTSVPATSRTFPPPSHEEPDMERIAAIAKAYGNELLA
jgi:mannose-6-phosphate isomerase-like protein (cupin superfamily)